MNYDDIYDKLISRAKSRQIEGYTEEHHIQPKCLFPELVKDSDNLVRLTPEEHYLAHLLLVKMNRYKGHANYNGLIFAAHRMTNGSKYQVRNNKFYGWLRKKVSATRKGIPRTEQDKQKMRKPKVNKTGYVGKVLSEEHKRKLSISHIGKVSPRRGVVLLEETKRKIGIANRTVWENKKART